MFNCFKRADCSSVSRTADCSVHNLGKETTTMIDLVKKFTLEERTRYVSSVKDVIDYRHEKKINPFLIMYAQYTHSLGDIVRDISESLTTFVTFPT